MSTPYEWRINDIERTANEAKSKLYQLDTLRSSMDSLEYTSRETSSCIAGLRDTCQALLSRIEMMEQQITELQQRLDTSQ